MTSILIGRKHGQDKWEFILDLSVPHSVQVVKFNELNGAKTNEQYQEIGLYAIDAQNAIRRPRKFVTKAKFDDQAAKNLEYELQLAKQDEESKKRAELQKSDADKSELTKHREQVSKLDALHDSLRAITDARDKSGLTLKGQRPLDPRKPVSFIVAPIPPTA